MHSAPAATAVVALLVLSSAAWNDTLPLRLSPGRPGWSLVHGAGPAGQVRDRVRLSLPGLDRTTARLLALDGRKADGSPVTLTVVLDGGPPQDVRTSPGNPTLVAIPPAETPGLHLELRAGESAVLHLTAIEIPARRLADVARSTSSLAVAAAAATAAWILVRHAPSVATPLMPALLGLTAAATLPLLAFRLSPWPPAAARLALPMIALGVSLVLGLRGPARRRAYLEGLALLTALVLGAWVRILFLPSAGSWDTEYWKAWMRQASTYGVAHVYGGPDAVPPGHLLAQMRGQEPLWQVADHGRSFVVDYPPGAMAAWRVSWAFVSRLGAWGSAEAEHIAVKLPMVLGDVAAVALLLLAFRGDRRRGLTLAALYWALPASWLSSAVLGFLDGACAPVILAALLAAARKRGAWAGAALAAACLLKPTAIIVAPAMIVALWPARPQLVRAVVAGLAMLAAALVPFLFAGTLVTAVVHCYRILFQGTLSGGFPNPWWLGGHVLNVVHGVSPWPGPVAFARTTLLPFPPGLLGSALFLGLAAWLCARQRRAAADPVFTGAALFYAYGMVAVGVHENHPHPLVLLLLASGLATRRLRALAAVVISAYVLNMLCLSGLGRFYGARHEALQPLAETVAGLRLALGFDLTLLLTAVNLVVFAYLLLHFDELTPSTSELVSPGKEKRAPA